MKKTLYIILVFLLIIFFILLYRVFLVNQTSTWSCGDDFVDQRDGNVYSTVEIGDQCWFAQNLAYLPKVFGPQDGSETAPIYYVYDYDGTDVILAKKTKNYQMYGVLYNYPASLTACPEGWSLPSDNDWQELEKYLGMDEEDLNQEGWRFSGDIHSQLADWIANGTNSTGFTALPTGSRCPGKYFDYEGEFVLFRSSTKTDDGSSTWVRSLNKDTAGILRLGYGFIYGHSVRCLYNY